MSIFDIFKVKKFKKIISSVSAENEYLKTLLKPEHDEIIDLDKKIAELKSQAISLQIKIKEDELNFQSQIQYHYNMLNQTNNEINYKRDQLLVLDEQLLLESFALYEPRYHFISSEEYKLKLDNIRLHQKELIKTNKAVIGNMNWTVNNSSSEGKKMVKEMIKLIIRTFNTECDACVEKVKFNNIETFEKRIIASRDALEKLGRLMNITISNEFFKLKLNELYLAHEYQLKKQEEKEEQKALREQIREENKIQKELEEARKNIDKEKIHYTNAYSKLQTQIQNCTNEIEKELLLQKANEIETTLQEIDEKIKSLDYREANQKAGYVYIISNIGSFGEDIYKIGMTRRLEPMDRISELGDASVPFNFDVHALIFSNDAPKLEAILHKEFESYV